MISIQSESSPLEWRGSNELRRLSTVHRARPVIRVFGHIIPVGHWQVVIENIQQLDPSLISHTGLPHEPA